MKIRYLEKVSVSDIFACQMCGYRGRDKYLATPQAASLVSWTELTVCKKCAKRETGSKNVKRWNEIHEKRADS